MKVSRSNFYAGMFIMKSALFTLVLLLGGSASIPMHAQTVGQDVKNAGADTKRAAKTGTADTKNGVKKGARATKHGVKRGTHKAASATENGAHKVKEKTTGTGTQK